MLTEYERGFLEAAIDADGCIGIWVRKPVDNDHRRRLKSRWRPYVIVTNTNLAFLEKIKSICGNRGFIRKSTYRKARQRNWKDGYAYVLTIEAMREILPQLHLTIKEERRLLCLEFLELTKSDVPLQKLHELYLKMRRLNKRGKRPLGEKVAGSSRPISLKTG